MKRHEVRFSRFLTFSSSTANTPFPHDVNALGGEKLDLRSESSPSFTRTVHVSCTPVFTFLQRTQRSSQTAKSTTRHQTVETWQELSGNENPEDFYSFFPAWGRGAGGPSQAWTHREAAGGGRRRLSRCQVSAYDKCGSHRHLEALLSQERPARDPHCLQPTGRPRASRAGGEMGRDPQEPVCAWEVPGGRRPGRHGGD